MPYVYIIVDVVLISFFVLERLLRKGKDAKTFQRSEYDKRSTSLLGFSFVVSTLLIIYTPLFNHYGLGTLRFNLSFNISGIFILLLGVAVRVAAAVTLGRFYTRTLRETVEHELITKGLYKYIRHPGYLGTILINIGAGISVGNIIILLIISVLILSAYTYRIKVEEEMLIDIFGDKYKAYVKISKKLFPFVY